MMNKTYKPKATHQLKSEGTVQSVASSGLLKRAYCLRYMFVLVGLLSLSQVAKAQQDPLFTQYMTCPVTVNPAIAGIREIHNVSLIFREQWIGIEGAPRTSIVSYSGPYRNAKVGLAGTLIYDELGPIQQTGFYANYRYKIRLSNKRESFLSFGLMGGFNYYKYDFLNLNSNEYDDYVMQDPVGSSFLPNFGFGCFYYQENFFAGASVPKLLRNSISDNEETNVSASKEERHTYLLTGGIINLNDNFDFRPSAYGRFVNGSPSSLDINATFVYKDKIWLGALYRFKASIGCLVRWQMSNRLHLGYSYDMSSNRLKQYNSGSHEIYLSYDFRPKAMGEELFKKVARFF